MSSVERSFARRPFADGHGAAACDHLPVRTSGITFLILGLAAGPSRLSASLRPRTAGLKTLPPAPRAQGSQHGERQVVAIDTGP